MISNPHLVRAFEREQIRRTPADFKHNLRIVEALYDEACLLGVWPPSDPLDGIENCVQLSRALNALTTPDTLASAMADTKTRNG